MHQITIAQGAQSGLHHANVVSIPQSRTVLRLPGSRFSMEQKTSLPKQENTCLSTACTSGSREAISDTVSPNPFAYCVLISVGIFKIPAKRISSCEFLSNCSFCTIGGRSFSWISTTMSAHWLASRERRATSLYSLVIGLTLPRTVAMRNFQIRFYPAEKHEPKRTSAGRFYLAPCAQPIKSKLRS